MLALWGLLLLLLSVSSGGGISKIWKCCPPFKMLSGDGKACVEAPWARHGTKQEPVYDAKWANRWLPPGLPLHHVEQVWFASQRFFKTLLVRAVEASAEYDERQEEAQGTAYWSRRVVFYKDGRVLRRDSFARNLAQYTTYQGCVDAARPPLAPFALLIEPDCRIDECFSKCCYSSRVMVLTGGEGTCRNDTRGEWSPAKSSFARFITPELSSPRTY